MPERTSPVRQHFGALGVVLGLVIGAITVFQGNEGLWYGVGLLAAAALVAIALLAWHFSGRRRLGRTGLTRRERSIVQEYHAGAVADLVRELPLPCDDAEGSFADQILAKSAYVPPPYRVESGSGSRRSRQSTTDREPVGVLIDFLGRDESVLVLGDPGSGKTILAALTFCTLADQFVSGDRNAPIPVFIRLNSLMTDAGGAPATLVELLPDGFRRFGAERLERLLKERRFRFILDGLDELPDSRTTHGTGIRMPRQLIDLVHHPVVVTCRVAFHNLYVDGDRVKDCFDAALHVLPLTYEGEIVPFVERYSAGLGMGDSAPEILDMLRSNESLSETLSRPLMLRMTVDVLSHEIEESGPDAARRVLLTGSDYLNAQVYESYVDSWIKREHAKSEDPQLRPYEKLEVIGHIAWQIFRSPVRSDAGYGAFELRDLLIDRKHLVAAIDEWLQDEAGGRGREIDRRTAIVEIEERSFLIVGEQGDAYRFVHKSFFEYLLARHVYHALARPAHAAGDVAELLSLPLPDEVIDFLRELLHRSKSPNEEAYRRGNVEQSLLRVLTADPASESGLMARQQAANLLPIVASEPTRRQLRLLFRSEEHPFIRRAIAVGEALHHEDPELLDAFVVDLFEDPRTRSFHMGYNRIYYGDQPLSATSFEDDQGIDCARFFRACIRHLQLDRYRYLRTMDLATLRLMLDDQSRCGPLLEKEAANLREVLRICARPDPELGQEYERQRLGLLETLAGHAVG